MNDDEIKKTAANGKPEQRNDAIMYELARMHRLAIKWLGSIILIAVLGVIFITVVDETTLRVIAGGDDGTGIRGNQGDQAVALLGNIAAAGVGGLVGWVARDFVIRRKDLVIDAGHHGGEE